MTTFTHLPTDIIFKIFGEYLTVFDIIKFGVICKSLNKIFLYYLHNAKYIDLVIRFDDFPTNISGSFYDILGCLVSYCTKLEHIVIGSELIPGNIYDKTLELLFFKNKNLKIECRPYLTTAPTWKAFCKIFPTMTLNLCLLKEPPKIYMPEPNRQKRNMFNSYIRIEPLNYETKRDWKALYQDILHPRLKALELDNYHVDLLIPKNISLLNVKFNLINLRHLSLYKVDLNIFIRNNKCILWDSTPLELRSLELVGCTGLKFRNSNFWSLISKCDKLEMLLLRELTDMDIPALLSIPYKNISNFRYSEITCIPKEYIQQFIDQIKFRNGPRSLKYL